VAQARHARLGVAHGRGRVAVDRTEVALAVHQHVAEREGLRHAHQGVVHRLVAMRVVLADHVADDARRLVVGLVAVRAELVHRVQDAPMDRLEAVADVGERAAHDHAHGVIEVAAAHLVLEVDRDDFLGELGHRDPFEGGSGFRFRAPRTGYAGGRTEVTDSITSSSLTQAGYVLKSRTCAALRGSPAAPPGGTPCTRGAPAARVRSRTMQGRCQVEPVAVEGLQAQQLLALALLPSAAIGTVPGIARTDFGWRRASVAWTGPGQRPNSDCMASAPGRSTMPFSVTIASISSAGVTSNTGFQARTPSATVRVPPVDSSSPGSRSSISIRSPEAVPMSTVDEGATTMKRTPWWRAAMASW